MLLLSHPQWAHAGVPPRGARGARRIELGCGASDHRHLVGTMVAPWQLFFQQSNVVDKRITPGCLATNGPTQSLALSSWWSARPLILIATGGTVQRQRGRIHRRRRGSAIVRKTAPRWARFSRSC